VAIAVALSVSLAAPAAAVAASCPRTTLGDVESEVMCLECGVPLDVAEGSLQANQERAFITRQIAACRTTDQIKSALAAQYGDRVLAAPKAKGIGLAAYVVPIVAFLAAAVALAFAAVRWRGRRARLASAAAAAGGNGDGPSPTPDPRESARLDADLGRYDP
jgi:cytochrome c-type biogenesis protein CcmH/NrfF